MYVVRPRHIAETAREFVKASVVFLQKWSECENRSVVAYIKQPPHVQLCVSFKVNVKDVRLG